MSFDRPTGKAISEGISTGIAAGTIIRDGSILVVKDDPRDKRTRKMPKSYLREWMVEHRAERLAREAAEPPREPLPF